MMTLPHLSEDEIRHRIFANASVLFPSTSNENDYEIVYAAYPRIPEKKAKTADPPPWQYAILVRKDTNGNHQLLLKGSAWSTAVPWTHALRGLLDASAAEIHKSLAKTALPGVAGVEELPGYSPPIGESSSGAGEKGASSEAVERGT